MDNKKLYIVSISIALILYIAIILFILYYISSQNVKSYDAATKETTIELDLVSLPVKKDIKDTVQPTIKKTSTKKAKKIVKKSTSRSSKRTANMKSLFGKVKIKSAKVVKQNVLNIKSSMTNSRYKSKFEKEKKTENVKVSNSLNKIKDISNKKISLKSIKENDQYYSKIYQILSSRFIPRQIEEDLSAKVLITITNDGIFSYTFVQYSNSETYNQQLMVFLDSQINETFPSPSNRSSVDIEIIFKTKK